MTRNSIPVVLFVLTKASESCRLHLDCLHKNVHIDNILEEKLHYQLVSCSQVVTNTQLCICMEMEGVELNQ